MGDWLHCNSCFLQPGEGTKFYLTNCRHIFCQKCLEKGVCKENCAVCGNTCSIIPMSGKMRPETDIYFRNPSDFISESTKKALQVLAFQDGHRTRYVSYLKNEIKKMRDEMNNVRQAFIKFKALERDLMQEKKEYLGLKEELTKARKELIHCREEISYLKNIISEKGIGLSSPGSMRSQRTSPIGRSQISTSRPLSRGPSPVFSYSQSLNMRSESPMNFTDTATSAPVSRGKSPGVKNYDMLQFYHQNMSPVENSQTPESRYQRVPSSALSSYSQGYSNSHHSGLPQSAKLPDVMITSGRLQVRTPPSGGKIGRIGTTPPSHVPVTPKSAPQLISLAGNTQRSTPQLISLAGHAPGSAPQLISLAGHTPRLMNFQRSET